MHEKGNGKRSGFGHRDPAGICIDLNIQPQIIGKISKRPNQNPVANKIEQNQKAEKRGTPAQRTEIKKAVV